MTIGILLLTAVNVQRQSTSPSVCPTRMLRITGDWVKGTTG